MRFKRYITYPFEDTRRKRLALARRQRLDREKLPLFSELIGETQPDADTIMHARAELWQRTVAANRAWRAAAWRQARKRLCSYPDEDRRRLAAYWQKCVWPADPTYLHSMMHMFDTGRLDVDFVPRPFGGRQ
jgi:hypothetical protein